MFTQTRRFLLQADRYQLTALTIVASTGVAGLVAVFYTAAKALSAQP